MICAARNEAPGFRVESWAEGREQSEDGADDRSRPHKLGSLCCGRGVFADRCTVSPAQPHQEGVTETSVSVEMGASKTVPPASTREETSSLKDPLTPGDLGSDRDLIIADRSHHQITGDQMKFITICDYTGIIECEIFAQTYRRFGLETVRHPVVELEARVMPFDRGAGCSSTCSGSENPDA